MKLLKQTEVKKKGKATAIDAEVGNQLRQRRLSAGMSQEELANKVDMTFQQIQKYENGTNRISASKLYEFSKILNVPIQAFFSTWQDDNTQSSQAESATNQDILQRKETHELLRSYYNITSLKMRKDFLNLLKAMSSQ